MKYREIKIFLLKISRKNNSNIIIKINKIRVSRNPFFKTTLRVVWAEITVIRYLSYKVMKIIIKAKNP